MKFSHIRQLVVVIVFCVTGSLAVAQNQEEQGSYALRIYYSDLYLALSPYDMNDVPFAPRQVKIGRNDTLISIARKNRFSQLDAFHLAAAIFEANPQAFTHHSTSQLKVGATLSMPTVADIFVAQDRYEKLKVVGDELILNTEENQMRNAQRWPFGKSLVMIGPSAKDELPRNQVVTLTSYRPEDSPSSPETAGEDFLTRAARAQGSATNNGAAATADALSADSQSTTYSKWLDGSDSTSLYSDNALLENKESLVAAVAAPASTGNSPTDVSTESELQLWSETASLLNAEVSKAEVVNLQDLQVTPATQAQTVESVVQESAVAQEQSNNSRGVIESSRVLSGTQLGFKVTQPLELRELQQLARLESQQNNGVDTVAAVEQTEVDLTSVAAEEKPSVAVVNQTIEAPQIPVAEEPVAVVTAPKLPPVDSTPVADNQQLTPDAPAEDTDALADNNSTESDADPLSSTTDNKSVLENPIVPTIAAVKPLVTTGAGFKSASAAKLNYLGAPENVDSLVAPKDTADPLSYVVEWRFDDSVQVGTVLEKLADYIGYELVSDDTSVLETYGRTLPRLQRTVTGLSAEEGFDFLAGRGFDTVFDHVARSVKHVPKLAAAVETTARPQVIDPSPTHLALIKASGVTSMLKQFPEDIVSAAGRHADRCESDSGAGQPDADRIYQLIVSNLTQNTPEPVTRSLVDWYKSATGRKVLELESMQIDDAALQKFSMDRSRTNYIEQIYENTVTGRGITDIAVELDYAGWALSGCQQHAEATGEVNKMREEMMYGQNIRKKSVKLESLLREDMLLSMAYQFDKLTDLELSEYADVITEHAGLYSELQQSIIDAIELETSRVSRN